MIGTLAIWPTYFVVGRNHDRSTLTDELSRADPAPTAAERPIGAIGRIERAVETGTGINVALLLAETADPTMTAQTNLVQTALRHSAVTVSFRTAGADRR
jgi:hypothetical protein